MPAIQKHRDLVREMHGKEAGPPLLADFSVCVPIMNGAEETARQYMGKFVASRAASRTSWTGLPREVQ
jgi:hypothetical protein